MLTDFLKLFQKFASFRPFVYSSKSNKLMKNTGNSWSDNDGGKPYTTTNLTQTGLGSNPYII